MTLIFDSVDYTGAPVMEDLHTSVSTLCSTHLSKVIGQFYAIHTDVSLELVHGCHCLLISWAEQMPCFISHTID